MKTIDPHQIRRLLVRSPNWIGDAVMATPAMGDIRATFPNASVSVAASPVVAELFRSHPYCDDVLIIDRQGKHRGLRGRFRFARELARRDFDLAILLQNAFEAGALAYLARIPARAGYAVDGRSLLLTHKVPADAAAKSIHQVEYYRHMVHRLGIEGGDGTLRLEIIDGERASARERLGPGSFIALNPGAAYGAAKRWHPDRFARTADMLSLRYDARIVLVGGSGEMKIGRDIAAIASCATLNLVGRTTIRETMGILSLCRLIITNDSGPMHVAAALGVPIVALFGPTDPVATAPRAEARRVIRRKVDCAPCRLRECPTDHRCMTAIDADAVVTAARELLEGAG